MAETNPTLEEALRILPTRDLRYYGVYTHLFQESLAVAEICAAEEYDAQKQDILANLYAQTLPMMNPAEQGSILHKLRRCPPRPR